ncbi:hypothetical protein SDC9_204597 [bioreactor metagenome]|uniref:Uncharacterized protein n=1 Tax=bioreactor metagenome TaxID=1076179 RepID=A0A645J8U8_9ZZZZ
MNPILGHGPLKPAFRLGNLVFVMGKNQVGAAAVNIEAFTQVFVGHGRAFNMPAGPARSPGAFPRGLTGLCLFP